MSMKEVAIGVLIAVLLIDGCAITQSNIRPESYSDEALSGLEAFDQAMLAFMAENYLPGGTLAVAYESRLVLAKGYGFASIGFTKSEPMQPEMPLAHREFVQTDHGRCRDVAGSKRSTYAR